MLPLLVRAFGYVALALVICMPLVAALARPGSVRRSRGAARIHLGLALLLGLNAAFGMTSLLGILEWHLHEVAADATYSWYLPSYADPLRMAMELGVTDPTAARVGSTVVFVGLVLAMQLAVRAIPSHD